MFSARKASRLTTIANRVQKRLVSIPAYKLKQPIEEDAANSEDTDESKAPSSIATVAVSAKTPESSSAISSISVSVSQPAHSGSGHNQTCVVDNDAGADHSHRGVHTDAGMPRGGPSINKHAQDGTHRGVACNATAASCISSDACRASDEVTVNGACKCTSGNEPSGQSVHDCTNESAADAQEEALADALAKSIRASDD
jgi:hypothetical protein